MESLIHIDLYALAKTAGYIGLAFIIFAESGLFFGFFLPGDSLLFTAGLLASQGFFDILPLVFIMFISAVTGDQVGYWFGKKVGPKIFNREDSFWFRKDHIVKAHDFYTKHGKKTIVLARFIPIIRTFAPIIAGVGGMHYRTFVVYNVIGGLLWGVGVTLLGYFLGELVPEAEKYFLLIIALIIILSILPPIISFARSRRN